MIWLTGILNNKWVGLALVSLAAICLIFYKFAQIPGNISYDELEFAQLALSLAHHSYVPYSPLATGHSTLYFYIILLSFKIFGVSTFSLRLPAAIFGVLGIMVFYLLLRQSTKLGLLALVSALALLGLRWYFNFARFSFEATFLLFLELCSIYFLLSFLHKKNSLYAVLTALFAGIAFHSYYPGKIFFLIPAAFIFIYARKFFLPFFVVLCLVISPLVFYTGTVKENRVQQQLYLMGEKIPPSVKADYFLQNVIKTSGMFMIAGDMNGRHNYPGKPALNPIIGVIAIAGFILMLKNGKKMNNQIFLSYFAISLFPTILTFPSENPNMLRTFTILPSIGYGIFCFLDFMTKTKFKLPKNLFISLVLMFMLVSAIYELRTYFAFQSRVFRNAFEIKCPLEKVVNYTRTSIPLSCRVRKNEY